MNSGLYFGQMVIGPAGSGKSTYCKIMQQMAQTLHRRIIIINLDPAAEYNTYKCDCDIQELISLQDVMQQLQLGPNGALLFCIQYLIQNQVWLSERLGELIGGDDYVLFDCPGQIQLFNDVNFFREVTKFLQNYGFSLISIYMIDVNFISEENKFLSGILQALSAQIALQLPSITVLSKCDLLQDKNKIQKYTSYFNVDNYETQLLQTGDMIGQVKKILDQNGLVSIRSLNLEDEDSIRDLLLQADLAIQYGENLQPNEKMFEKVEQNLNIDENNE